MLTERIGDGDTKSRIRISKDEAGTITLQVIQFNRAGLNAVAQVEYKKDGPSPSTYKVLDELFEAVEKDNSKRFYPTVRLDVPWPNDPE